MGRAPWRTNEMPAGEWNVRIPMSREWLRTLGLTLAAVTPYGVCLSLVLVERTISSPFFEHSLAVMMVSIAVLLPLSIGVVIGGAWLLRKRAPAAAASVVAVHASGVAVLIWRLSV